MSRIVPLSVSVLLVALAGAQTPALRKGVSVQMPVTTNAMTVLDADTADSLVAAVTFRGVIFLEVTTVTPAQLSGRVKAELREHPGKKVYLKGDARTPYSAIAEVLDALRTAGVNAPILLTNQRAPADASYVPPAGLEVLLPPAPDAAALRVGHGQPSTTELQQRAQRGQPVVLQMEEDAPFGEVVHVVDVCRAAGATVYLATPVK